MYNIIFKTIIFGMLMNVNVSDVLRMTKTNLHCIS